MDEDGRIYAAAEDQIPAADRERLERYFSENASPEMVWERRGVGEFPTYTDEEYAQMRAKFLARHTKFLARHT